MMSDDERLTILRHSEEEVARTTTEIHCGNRFHGSHSASVASGIMVLLSARRGHPEACSPHPR